MNFPRANRLPPREMYLLARRKLGSHQDVIDWFFKPVTEGAACPQSLLNINADFLVKEMLEKLPNHENNPN